MPLLTKKAFIKQKFVINSQPKSQTIKFKTPLLTKENIDRVLCQNISQNANVFTSNSLSPLSKQDKTKPKNKTHSSVKNNLIRSKSNSSVISVHLSFEEGNEKGSEKTSSTPFRENKLKNNETYFQFVKNLSQSSNQTSSVITSSPVSQSQTPTAPNHKFSQIPDEFNFDVINNENFDPRKDQRSFASKECISDTLKENLKPQERKRKKSRISTETKKVNKSKQTKHKTGKRNISSLKGGETEQLFSSDSSTYLSQEMLNKTDVKAAYVEFSKQYLEKDKEAIEELNVIKNLSQRKRKYILNSSSDEPLNEPLMVKKNKRGKQKEKRNIKKCISGEKSSPFEKKIAEVKKRRQKQKTEKNCTKQDKSKKDLKACVKGGELKKNFSDDINNNLTFEEKMVLIQDSRNVGLYVLCDICNKARYLPHIKDPLDLPHKWYCAMNPDDAHNKCSDPEEVNEEEEYLIENLYNAGSIVWAKMDGYPWWPAMVEDDPDTEDYFWLEGNSMKPTWYHVTFFDSDTVTRAWMRPMNLQPFKTNMYNPQFEVSAKSKFKYRLDTAFEQACDAIELPLIDRLKKYTFMKRYNKSKKKSQNKNSVDNQNNRKKRQTQSRLLTRRNVEKSRRLDDSNRKGTDVAVVENGKKSDISLVLNQLNWEDPNLSLNLLD